MAYPAFIQSITASPGTLSRDKADTLLLLATCMLVLAPHVTHLPVWVGMVCGGILLWRAWLTFHGNRMPSRWLLVPIAVLAMAAVYWNYHTLFGREAGVAMLVMLLTFKLLEMHARRDLFVILFLGFFLILTGFFYSQSLGTAFLMVAAVLAILTTQLSFQYTGMVPPLGQRLRLGVYILVLATPLMLVFFVLFPRIQGPLWGMPSEARSGRTGLSENMAPGEIASLAQSDDIAFRVKFAGPPPDKAALYWRGPVLGHFDGRLWQPLRSRIYYRGDNSSFDRKLMGPPVAYEVTLEPSGRPWLYALDLPQAPPRLAGNPAVFSPDFELHTQVPINDRVRYDAVSFPNYTLQPNALAQTLRPWLELPENYNPRSLAFARRLMTTNQDPVRRITAVLAFFRQEHFRYTLEPPPLGRNVIDEFLFDTRAGFCEHYSAAFVVLMRAMNIPARVVTGYQGGEINPSDGFMTVRQSDAHAWAEVWLAGRGWVRIDPTSVVAPDRIEMNLNSALPRQYFGGLLSFNAGKNDLLGKLRGLRQRWEAVTNAWNQWVLNFTPEQQKSLLRSLGFSSPDWRTLTLLLSLAGSVILGLITLWLIGQRPQLDPAEAMYRNLCQRLARQGYAREAFEGPRAYRTRLNSADCLLPPGRKIAIARFLDAYEAIRYGRPGDASPASRISTLKFLYVQCR